MTTSLSRSLKPLIFAGMGAAALVMGASMLRQQARRQIARDTPDSAPARASIAHSRFGGYAVTGRSITVNRSRRAVYEYWRDFGNLAHIMDNLEAVVRDGDLTRWSIRAPFGRIVEVETEIVEDRPERLIAWRSTSRSDIDTHGKVVFHEGASGRGTILELIIAYKPPAGKLGRLVAKAAGREPLVQARQDLRRLKMLLETGEIADHRSSLPQEGH